MKDGCHHHLYKMVCHQGVNYSDEQQHLGDVVLSHRHSEVDSSGGDGVEGQIPDGKGNHPSQSPSSNPNMGRI